MARDVLKKLMLSKPQVVLEHFKTDKALPLTPAAHNIQGKILNNLT